MAFDEINHEIPSQWSKTYGDLDRLCTGGVHTFVDSIQSCQQVNSMSKASTATELNRDLEGMPLPTSD